MKSHANLHFKGDVIILPDEGLIKMTKRHKQGEACTIYSMTPKVSALKYRNLLKLQNSNHVFQTFSSIQIKFIINFQILKGNIF